MYARMQQAVRCPKMVLAGNLWAQVQFSYSLLLSGTKKLLLAKREEEFVLINDDGDDAQRLRRRHRCLLFVCPFLGTQGRCRRLPCGDG